MPSITTDSAAYTALVIVLPSSKVSVVLKLTRFPTGSVTAFLSALEFAWRNRILLLSRDGITPLSSELIDVNVCLAACHISPSPSKSWFKSSSCGEASPEVAEVQSTTPVVGSIWIVSQRVVLSPSFDVNSLLMANL